MTVRSAEDFAADVTDEVGDVTVTWQFGDGEVTGESVEHGFGSPGTETVEVVVEDEYGATATAEVQVAVRSQDDPGGEGTATGTPDSATGTGDASGGVPGFGLAAAVVALLAAALLAIRRP